MSHYFVNLNDVLDDHDGDIWGVYNSLESLLEGQEITCHMIYEDLHSEEIIEAVTQMANSLMLQYKMVKALIDTAYIQCAFEDKFPLDLNELGSIAYVPSSIEPVKCEAHASWTFKDDPTHIDTNEFHISCGDTDDGQGDGYFSTDEGAKLLFIQHEDDTWTVTLTSPSQGLEYCPDYWLSPNNIEFMGEEVCPNDDWCIREVQA
jgi:hypothetical protein